MNRNMNLISFLFTVNNKFKSENGSGIPSNKKYVIRYFNYTIYILNLLIKIKNQKYLKKKIIIINFILFIY